MMSMETTGSIGQVENLIKKKRCKRRVKIQLKRTVKVVFLSLQRLFDLCEEVFKGHGIVPSPSDVQKLCNILDGMKLEDVGVREDLQFFKSKSEVEGTPRVTSTTIYKCDNFELSMFFLPENAVIPLHNHPEMSVFSKLLLGTMHIKAYDWVVDPLISDHYFTSSSKLRLAKLKEERIFTTPSNASVLYPTSGGNIHEFTAITPCAVLDVIGPPYLKISGRDCSYYKDIPLCTSSDRKEVIMEVEDDENCYSWLEEIETPKESAMDEIEYRGPRILIKSNS